MDRAARPAGTAGNPARVQQDQTLEDDWAYDADSQAEAEAEAENLARLEGDEDLLLTLQLGGFSEAVWSPVANELARYGLAVMKSWIRKRSIFVKVKQKTGHRLHMIDGWPDDEDLIDQLATDTVVAALGYFKDHVLMPGKWDPRRGASLRTFFIGQCVFQFPNRYKPRVDEEVRRRASGVHITCTDDLAPFDGTSPGVDTAALQAVELVETLGSIKDRRAAAAFVLQAQGYPHAQIAERLGLADAKSAENLIRYNANKIKKRRSS